MTKQSQILQSAPSFADSMPPLFHEIPSFGSPYYKFTCGRVRIDEKNFSDFPMFIAEDLERSSIISVVFEDMKPIKEEDEEDENEEIKIFICDNSDGHLVYEHSESTDGLEYQIIELKDCIRRLHEGTYTMYISNVMYVNEPDQAFDYHDNASMFSFKIISRAEALSEPAPHDFVVSTIGDAHPMMADGIRLDFDAGQGSVRYRDFCCFNENEVLMYEMTGIAPQINCLRMTSSHIWQPGRYTCLFDNGLIPTAGLEFVITPDGHIEWKEGMDEQSAAYQLVRIRERDLDLYHTIQENANRAGDHQYVLKCIEWYEHVILNRLCNRYECPVLFESTQLDEVVSMPDRYNAKHAMDLLFEELRHRHLHFTPQALLQLHAWFVNDYARETPWDRCRLDNVAANIIKNFNERRQRQLDDHWTDLYSFLTCLEPEDLTWSQPVEEKDEVTDEFDKAMEGLRGMIGLDKLKSDVERIFTNVRFNRLRTSFGLPDSDSHAHHMLFFGNPGTGKTTVAKHIGQIFHAMGLLSDGDVIVTDRSKMVGRYIGETETKMQELLEEAEGKVLFIDEAYSLFVNDSENSDYGHRVIESLLPKMAEANPNMLVIMAGYEKELDKMVNNNPGLRGRFAHQLRFDDYSADELMLIAQLELDRGQYIMSEDAREFLADTVRHAVANKGQLFSNARWMEQYVRHGILPAMAERVMAMKTAQASDCQLIVKEDVEKAWPQFDPTRTKTSRKRVGF